MELDEGFERFADRKIASWHAGSQEEVMDLGECRFQDKNPTFEEWGRMSNAQAQAYLAEVEQRNLKWICRMYGIHESCWLVVIDGRVVDSSPNELERADDLTIHAYAKKHGVVPFTFASLSLGDDEGLPT